jgi:multiple sugar transport system ATP-binding protein
MRHYPAQLSGGQQQRVSLGRALIRDPAAFILDEVMSHLDAHLKFKMLFELKRIHRSLGKTTIYVTHDQVEALALADRIAVMSNAELQQYGTRDDLYHRPVNRFVADFIGEPPTNFFTGEVAEDVNGMSLKVDGSGLAFRPDEARIAALRQHQGRQVTIGIRPQNFSTLPSPGMQSVTARIVLNEYLGEQSIITLEAGRTSFRALAAPDLRPTVSEPISLYYRSSDVMVFDPKSDKFIG